MSYPAPKPAKFVHIAKTYHHGGSFSRIALCGRMVSVLSLGDETEVTCTKCAAEALLRSLSTKEG